MINVVEDNPTSSYSLLCLCRSRTLAWWRNGTRSENPSPEESNRQHHRMQTPKGSAYMDMGRRSWHQRKQGSFMIPLHTLNTQSTGNLRTAQKDDSMQWGPCAYAMGWMDGPTSEMVKRKCAVSVVSMKNFVLLIQNSNFIVYIPGLFWRGTMSDHN